MKQDTELAVKIEELNFLINGIEILKNINLGVGKGEFVGLIGPNGAGKTTLLKCINRIYHSSGTIKIQGRSLKQMTDREVALKVAMMHQNTTVSFGLPALDVVMMGRYPHIGRVRAESGEDFAIARKFMEYTDTAKFERKPVTQLSGGERQRVLFAKVLAQQTDIIMLDEPTASLDISHQEQIFKHSRSLSEAGRTVIAAVHDLKIASRYCSRLVLMKDGSVIADGSPEEVLTHGNLACAYGINAVVYRNKITGLLDFYIQGGYRESKEKNKYKVHVIGGGGSSSAVIRELYENGYNVTAGVFSPADSDLQCAEVFDIQRLVCEPFSEISESTAKSNIDMIRNADLTILCNMPFGKQNLRNLEAAKFAGKLAIIEDDSPKSRDFSGGAALETYLQLREKAVITTSAKLHEIL